MGTEGAQPELRHRDAPGEDIADRSIHVQEIRIYHQAGSEAGNSSCRCFEEKITFLGVQRKVAVAIKEDTSQHEVASPEGSTPPWRLDEFWPSDLFSGPLSLLTFGTL